MFRDLFDHSTHSQGAVELEWDLGEDIIRFVAHVVPRNSGLLLSRSALKALRATMDLRNDQLHLENPGALLKLSTTPAGHYETDLVNRTSGVAVVDSLSRIPGQRRKHFPRFLRGTDRSSERPLRV